MEPNRFGILWFIAPRQPLSAWHVVFASRPASIRTDPGPQARCQMGSLVLVGRCYLCGDLESIKTLNAVCPIATVMLYFDASQCSHSPLTPQLKFKCLVMKLFSCLPAALCRNRLLTVPQRFIHFAADP
jgi:hypothetical protein